MSMFRQACTGVFLAVVATTAVAQTTFDTPVPNAQLSTMTGGSDVTNNLTRQRLNGTVSNNETNRTYSGGNVVSGSAFSNSAGLSTVIQNSGNSVLIQNATIVNVGLK